MMLRRRSAARRAGDSNETLQRLCMQTWHSHAHELTQCRELLKAKAGLREAKIQANKHSNGTFSALAAARAVCQRHAARAGEEFARAWLGRWQCTVEFLQIFQANKQRRTLFARGAIALRARICLAVNFSSWTH